MSQQQWWRDAVIYQIYPRSWADADGDGMGDLPGITARLPHLAELGVDAVWLSPFYTSPQNDAGYDVADYRDVDPRFGTLADSDAMVAARPRAGPAGDRRHRAEPLLQRPPVVPGGPGLRPGQCRAGALRVPRRQRRERRRGPQQLGQQLRRTGLGARDRGGRLPGQWYLHLFDVTQPDFDWTNPEVGDEMESVLRFWLDRGADGFRIDVAHGLVKVEGLPDAPVRDHMDMSAPTADFPMWDQPGVHDIYRRWRKVTDSYAVEGKDADRILCAEAWVQPSHALALYVRDDELHQSFNFSFLMSPWIATEMQRVIERVAARGRALHRTADLGPVQPRRRPARLAARLRPRPGPAPDGGHRRRRPPAGRGGRPASRSRGDDGDAGAARVRLHLPGRGAGPAGGDRASRRRARGPHVGEVRSHLPRTRRLPRPDAVGGRRTVVRVRPVGELVAAAAHGVRRARRRPSDRRRGLDPRALPDPAPAASRAPASGVGS